MCFPNSNNVISDEIAHIPILGAIVKRCLRVSLVAQDAVARNPRRRLYRDIYDTTVTADTGRRPMASLGHGRTAIPGDSTGQDFVKTRGQRPAAGTRSQELPRSVSDDPQRFATRSGLGTVSGNRTTALDIGFTVSNRPHRVDPTLSGGAPPQPGAAARAGDLLPQLRWLLTEAAGTVANVAHRLETSAVEIDDDARGQLSDDISVLSEELTTVKVLLGNSVDWDAEVKRLLGGTVPPLERGDDQDEGDAFG